VHRSPIRSTVSACFSGKLSFKPGSIMSVIVFTL
jgi:hypothetical protein